jgi:hypothetical protein
MIISRTMVIVILALFMNASALINSDAEELWLRSTNSVFVAPLQAAKQRNFSIRAHSIRKGETKKKFNLKVNPIAKIPLSSLIATRERPIFSPSRRPPLIKAPAPITPTRNEEPNRPSLTLLGAISAGSQGMAIFFDKKSGTAIRMRIGEARLGWTLRRVTGREATLESNQQTAVLSIPNP